MMGSTGKGNYFELDGSIVWSENIFAKNGVLLFPSFTILTNLKTVDLLLEFELRIKHSSAIPEPADNEFVFHMNSDLNRCVVI